jgi:hypothetical protein
MVDLDAATGPVTADDFVFSVNQADTPDVWTMAPTPVVTVQSGAGVGGADRVTIIWSDGAIVNQWLKVTVLATGNTGLAADDVFCFGNSVGDTDGDGLVDVDDFSTLVSELGQRGALGALASDSNADGRVGLGDFTAIRKRFGQSVLSPTLAAAPAAAPAPLAPQAVEAAISTAPSPTPLAAAPVASQPGGQSDAGSDLLLLMSSELPVSLSVGYSALGAYVPTPGITLAGSPEARVQLAATTESDLRPLDDDLLSGSAANPGDGLYVSNLGDDPLTDLLAESAISVPL